MSRPKKQGLDYFPVDVHFDEKIKALESLYENTGLVWILKFWQKAYDNENGEVNLSKYFGEIHAKDCRSTPEVSEKIIDLCLGIHLIKPGISEGCFTSNGIQKRIASVSKERKTALERYFKNKPKKIRVKESKVKESKVKDFGHTSAKYNLKDFIPPTWEEFESYCNENRHGGIARRAYDGYSAGDWHDSKGQKIISWKQKLQHVWFKDDNKDQQEGKMYNEL